jgi:hypothetical protein
MRRSTADLPFKYRDGCTRKMNHLRFCTIELRSATWALLGLLAVLAGCGTTKSRDASDQLLLSDAIDRSVANIDFSELSGKKVYFDTKYINPNKATGLVNTDYIISSLRQQLVASNCLLQEKIEDAEFVVEARVGAVGGHDTRARHAPDARHTRDCRGQETRLPGRRKDRPVRLSSGNEVSRVAVGNFAS